MGYQRKRLLFPISLAPLSAAAAMEIHVDKIRKAVRSGELPVFRDGCNKRILVRDLENWVRTKWVRDYWVPKKKRSKSNG